MSLAYLQLPGELQQLHQRLQDHTVAALHQRLPVEQMVLTEPLVLTEPRCGSGQRSVVHHRVRNTLRHHQWGQISIVKARAVQGKNSVPGWDWCVLVLTWLLAAG